MPSKNIFWFKEIIDDDLHIVGEKGIKFSQLMRQGINIPDGFAITSHAFDEFIRENKLNTKAKHLLSTANHQDPNSILQISSHIRKYFNEGTLSSEFKLDLYRAYKKLGGTLVDSHVKLMLSPINETHFLKTHKSIDEVKGEASLIHAIKNCWSANFSEISLLNNHEKSNHIKSIIVQKILNPDLSGKIYTINPSSYDKNTVLIKSMLGEYSDQINLVSMPDIYTVNKKTHTIVSIEEVPQKKMKKADRKKIIDVPVKLNKRKKLKKEEIDMILKQAKTVENFTYFPQEIDWVIEKGKVYFIHIKPLTHIN